MYCPQELTKKGFQGWDKSGLCGMDLQACLAVTEKGSMPWKLWGMPPITWSARMQCSPRGQGSVTFPGTGYLVLTGQQLENKGQEKNKRRW